MTSAIARALIPLALAAAAWGVGRATGSQAGAFIGAPVGLLVGAWFGVSVRKFTYALAAAVIAVAAGFQGFEEASLHPSRFEGRIDNSMTTTWSERGSGKGATRIDYGAAIVRDGRRQKRMLLICRSVLTAGCLLSRTRWDGWGTAADEQTTATWRADLLKRAPAIAAAAEGLPFVLKEEDPVERRRRGRAVTLVLLLVAVAVFAWPSRRTVSESS